MTAVADEVSSDAQAAAAEALLGMASFLQISSSDTSYGFNDDIKMRLFLINKVTAVADEVSSDAQAAAA